MLIRNPGAPSKRAWGHIHHAKFMENVQTRIRGVARTAVADTWAWERRAHLRPVRVGGGERDQVPGQQRAVLALGQALQLAGQVSIAGRAVAPVATLHIGFTAFFSTTWSLGPDAVRMELLACL